MAIGDPSLLASSNENFVLPLVTALIELDSQSSESAAENVEPGKRKIYKKGPLKKQNLLLTWDSISFILLSYPQIRFRNRETATESVLVGTTWKKRDRGRGCRWRDIWQVVLRQAYRGASFHRYVVETRDHQVDEGFARCGFAGLWKAEKSWRSHGCELCEKSPIDRVTETFV
ncbi:hypothetical protein D8674_010099 [Pyrus ussuriensis x Pyrus communis]|uniref:Uncharacterized protein n=1 Tax=Pyrus ussuriensis x Pyrus communis TaxID=2448454 RepID=A0A5N5F9T3_9ROSA|nr:hypothetical protein D8674_010099 [Pyrus ussuriensis x Pyrus communis]